MVVPNTATTISSMSWLNARRGRMTSLTTCRQSRWSMKATTTEASSASVSHFSHPT